eukprot:scaffold7540_cov68-Phaeocystis_antarctica.AAC.1
MAATYGVSLYFIYCRGAFGGPSPASLTACMAISPRQTAPTPTYPAPIYNTSAKCAKHNVLPVGVGRNARRTRVGDRHARVAGCGGLGRQLP